MGLWDVKPGNSEGGLGSSYDIDWLCNSHTHTHSKIGAHEWLYTFVPICKILPNKLEAKISKQLT